MFSKRSTAKNKFHMLSKIQHERKCQMQQSRLVFLVILMLSKAFFFLFPNCISQVRLGQVEQAGQVGERRKILEKFVPCCLVFHSGFEIFKFTRNTLEYLVLLLSTNLRNLSTGDPYVLIARSRIFFFFTNSMTQFAIFEKLENKDNYNCSIKFFYLNLL